MALVDGLKIAGQYELDRTAIGDIVRERIRLLSTEPANAVSTAGSDYFSGRELLAPVRVHISSVIHMYSR